MKGRGSEKYLEIRYEDLVNNPEIAINEICQHFSIPSIKNIMDISLNNSNGVYVENWKARKEPQGWKQTPADPVSTASIGRYKKELTAREIDTLDRIELKASVRKELETDITTFGELLEQLHYRSDSIELRDGQVKMATEWQALERQDYARRVKRFRQNRRYLIPRKYTKIE